MIDEPAKLGAFCHPKCGCGALLVCNASNACGTVLHNRRNAFERRALATQQDDAAAALLVQVRH